MAYAPSPSVSIRALVDEPELALAVLAGHAGLDRPLTVDRVQKPGLALTGFLRQVHAERAQVLGATEIEFLATLSEEALARAVGGFVGLRPACILVTKGLDVPPPLLVAAEQAGIPLLRTPLMSSTAIDRIQEFLGDRLAPSAGLHGVLLDVLGVGVLLQGKSGVGKSEAALELVMRGHRLVADDLVEVQRKAGGALVGRAADLIKHHMEVRGLGIINVKDMFGVAAVRDTKKIELCVELVRWPEGESYDRLGLDDMSQEILGVPVPMLRLPVEPGRNVSSLVEVAARNRLLQERGHHSAREFEARLDEALAAARERRQREDIE